MISEFCVICQKTTPVCLSSLIYHIMIAKLSQQWSYSPALKTGFSRQFHQNPTTISRWVSSRLSLLLIRMNEDKPVFMAEQNLCWLSLAIILDWGVICCNVVYLINVNWMLYSIVKSFMRLIIGMKSRKIFNECPHSPNWHIRIMEGDISFQDEMIIRWDMERRNKSLFLCGRRISQKWLLHPSWNAYSNLPWNLRQ